MHYVGHHLFRWQLGIPVLFAQTNLQDNAEGPKASPRPKVNSHMTQSSHVTAQRWSCDAPWFVLTVGNSGEFVPELRTVEDGSSCKQQVSPRLRAEQRASPSGCRGSQSRCRSSAETHAIVVYVRVSPSRMWKETVGFLLLLLACVDSSHARRCSSFFCRRSHRVSGPSGVDPGSPLFLTPYLEKGAVDEGTVRATHTAAAAAKSAGPPGRPKRSSQPTLDLRLRCVHQVLR